MSHTTITFPNGMVACLGIFGFLLTVDGIIEKISKSKLFFRPVLRYLLCSVIGFIGSLIIYSIVTLFNIPINLSLFEMSILGVGAGIGGGYFPAYIRNVGSAHRKLVYDVPSIIEKTSEIKKLEAEKNKVIANYNMCKTRLGKAKVDLQEAERRIKSTKRVSARMELDELKAKSVIRDETEAKKRFETKLADIGKKTSKSSEEKNNMIND